MKVLAIDHGLKRLGFAISDDNHQFAAGLRVLSTSTNVSDVQLAIQVVNEQKPDRIIVGLPLGIDQKPTQQSLIVENFCKKVKKITGLEIVTWSEIGSSVGVTALARQKKKRHLDSEAARLLLQEYLDFINTGI
jgi:putative holliday junction resolvase